ncbi:MAG: CBS domain-containing protein [Patescibacteria group bacterium]
MERVEPSGNFISTVGELLQKVGQKEPYTIRPTFSVTETARLMAEHNISALLVINDEDMMTGIVTERDFARKIILKSKNPRQTRVGEVMTPLSQIVSVSVETDVRECARLMLEGGFRHLPVVRNGDIPEGIVSMRDLLLLLKQY